MAISYETLLPEILPMVHGCPDLLITNSIRASVVELCERASVYQAELDPLTTVANIYEYDLEAPAGTSVQKILWVTHSDVDLEPITTALLEQRTPKWRTEGGVPEYFVQQTSSTFMLAPVPGTTVVNSTIIRAVLRPTHNSNSCANDVMNDYRDTIVNGTLSRILRIPNKDWTDLHSASVYGQLFNQGVVDAERRARNADTGIRRSVRYGGSGSWRTRRRRYGNGG